MKTFARLFEISVGQVLVTKDYNPDDERFEVKVRWEPVGHAAATVAFSYEVEAACEAVFYGLTGDVLERLISGEGIDHIVAGLGSRASVLTDADTPSNRDLIRRVFLANGFTIKERHDDLKPYVYSAGIMLIACLQEGGE